MTNKILSSILTEDIIFSRVSFFLEFLVIKIANHLLNTFYLSKWKQKPVFLFLRMKKKPKKRRNDHNGVTYAYNAFCDGKRNMGIHCKILRLRSYSCETLLIRSTFPNISPKSRETKKILLRIRSWKLANSQESERIPHFQWGNSQ